MKSNKVDVLNGSIPKQLMLFFFPILFGSFFQQVYNTTDAIIVGNFVGKYALAAVGGSSASLINLFTGFAIGISSGASVIISQSFGNRDSENLSKAVHTSIAFSVMFGLFISIFMVIFGRDLLIMLKVPSEILAKSTTYLRVISAGFVSSLLFNMGTGILRAVGDTKRPLYYLIIAVIINIILDILFVAVFKMGVFGVAIATIIAQTISAFLVINSLVKSEFEYRVDINNIRIDINTLKQILLIGIPAGIQSSLFSLSNIIVQSSVNFLGADYVAAWTAIGKIDSIFWMTLGSFGISITTFSAQNFGAKKYQRVKDSIRICLVIATIVSVSISFILYITCPWIFRLFLTDTDVISIGVYIFRSFAPFFVTYVALEIIGGALRGIGDSIVPTIITLVGICALRIAWILIVFKANPVIDNVIICYPLTWIVTSIIFILYYLIYKPLDKKIKQQEALINI